MSQNILFDTHTFIWWADEPSKLSLSALSALENEDSVLFLSDASVWEMQIKSQLGKLDLKLPLSELIESQKISNDVEILPIDTEHILRLSSFPFHHKDPFDRLLLSQAVSENLSLVSVDEIFDAYGIDRLW
ncbi:MAG: type II toxin-antitoxin system VapC family toxin [Acidobacteria bacterium]|nr:type II toxin-antitoxin system VapC family toxin [Acidobacteriota bacterium]